MDFKIIVKEHREELKRIEREERIIQREDLKKARKFLKYPNILTILGARRCGKSIFSYLLVRGHNFGYINFDDERLIGIETKDLNRILESFYELYGDVNYIVLDEVQNVPCWELFVNRLRRTKRVIITGSNSRLLSGELADRLTGRYIDIILFPFSFKEFLLFKQFKRAKVYTTLQKAEILKLLTEYLKKGGFPEVHKFGEHILRRIYNDIITKDILLRYKIKKREEIRKLGKYLLTNFGTEISFKNLAKILDIRHVSTLSNWISYLESAFLIIKLERFSFKLKKQFLAPKKVYCVDNGIISAISFRFSENFGRLMENCVIIELKRRRKEVYYWKDYQQNEVDFVIKDGLRIEQLIQVTYAGDRDEIKERELKALIKGSKELRCDNSIVITWDYESTEKFKDKTIKFIPLWKWLLM